MSAFRKLLGVMSTILLSTAIDSQAAASQIDLAEYKACLWKLPGEYGRQFNEACYGRLKAFGEMHKADAKAQLAVGDLIASEVSGLDALGFYEKAITLGAKEDVCKSSRLARAIRDAHQVALEKQTTSAGKLSEICWAQVKDYLLGELMSGTDRYQASLCPVALRMKSLVGVRKSKCEKLAN